MVQRSQKAKVTVNEEIVGSIEHGLVLLVCFEKGDESKPDLIEKAASKILALRIFSDEAGKMNLNLLQTKGQILAISQFTLSWNGQKGNRPSFDQSMIPNLAEEKMLQFCERLRLEVPVAKGKFGASMQVELINDGPVTFCLDF